jgi:hypothetical protein
VLPAPTALALGGVKAVDCTGVGHVVAIGLDGAVTCASDLGASSALEPTSVFEWDEFLPANAMIGKLGRQTICSGTGAGVTAYTGATRPANHPGIYNLTTAASTNASCAIALGATVPVMEAWPDRAALGNWEMVFVVGTGSIDASDVLRVGAMDASIAGADLSKSAYTVESAGGNWKLKIYNASGTATSTVDTGVAIQGNAWYRIRMYATQAGSIRAQIGVNGGAYGTAVTAPAAGGFSTVPALLVKTGNTNSRTLQVDYYGARVGGLQR